MSETPAQTPAATEVAEQAELLKAARFEVAQQALPARRTPRVDNVEGKGAMVISISSRKEITASPLNPNHELKPERAHSSEDRLLEESIDTTTQALCGYRLDFLKPPMLEDKPEQPAPYLEKDAA